MGNEPEDLPDVLSSQRFRVKGRRSIYGLPYIPSGVFSFSFGVLINRLRKDELHAKKVSAGWLLLQLENPEADSDECILRIAASSPKFI
jgi:hypothetical protein